MLKSVEEGRVQSRLDEIELILKERRWWGKKPRYTRAQAEVMVDYQGLDTWGFPSANSYWRINGWGTKRDAERLTSAANLSQDGNVWLSLDLAHDITPYLS